VKFKYFVGPQGVPFPYAGFISQLDAEKWADDNKDLGYLVTNEDGWTI